MLSSYFNAFVCKACLPCPYFMLRCYLYNGFCFHGVFVVLRTHSLFISITAMFMAAYPCHGKFMCNNNRCVDQQYICDNSDSCGDNSDELYGCLLNTG